MNQRVWIPEKPEQSQMGQFMLYVQAKHKKPFKNYHDLHTWSIEYPGDFWQALCDFYHISFDKPAQQIVVQGNNMLETRWFNGAYFNFAQKLLSRRDNHLALISTNEQQQRVSLTYSELYQAVAQCSAGLRAMGIQAGDRIAAVMPNTPNTIIAMLATTSLGAIWSSCSPDFGTHAALDRLGQIEPKVLFICDGHHYLGKWHSGLDKIKELTQNMPSLLHTVVCSNNTKAINTNTIKTQDAFKDDESLPLSKIIAWDDVLKPATECQFVSLPFSHPVYILFSSGTTGKPKCIIHGAGGTLLQHIKELGLHTDLRPHDNLLFYTTCGWMMWNWVVSSLALGATLTLYEGAPTYPKATHLFQIIAEERVTVFGTSAKFISAIEKEGVCPKNNYELSQLRCILSTGSPLLPKNYDYIYEQVHPKVQLCSISGGTDIISCFALGNPILPVYRGELQCIGLGLSVDIFNEQGLSVKTKGELVCTKPFPSMPLGFWNDQDKSAYRRAYFERFPGIWAHGDFAQITAHHGLIIYGRSDAVLNPGGVRIGSAEIYRQVEQINEVLDSIVVGQDWHDDVRVVLFVKLRDALVLNEELIATIKKTIKEHASPRHVPALILQVPDIPRTINGKIVELAVRQVIHNQPVNNLQSLANPEALDHFKDRKELS